MSHHRSYILCMQCADYCCCGCVACVCVAAVIANMRGESPEAVAALLMSQPGLQGLQGPTISPVYGPGGCAGMHHTDAVAYLDACPACPSADEWWRALL